MKPTIAINMADLNRSLATVALEMKKPLRTVILEQAKLFVRDLMNATPPFNPKSTVFGKTILGQQIGKRAVERDIRKVFVPVEGLIAAKQSGKDTDGRRMAKWLKVYAREGRLGAATKLLRIMGWKGAISTVARPYIHKAARGTHGRVRKRTPWTIVLNKASITDYIRAIKGHVGKSKAGWMTAASALGVIVPPWVKKHSSPGGYNDDTKNAHKPNVTISNALFFAGDNYATKQMQAAIDNRAKAMLTRLEYVLGKKAEKLNRS